MTFRGSIGFVAALALACAVTLAGAQRVDSGPSDAVTLRIIIVGTSDEAVRIRARLVAGEDFATLARKISLDPSADRGGLLGTVSKATLRPELRTALRDVAAGGLTPVVAVPTGFAVLRVEPDPDAGGVTYVPGGSVAATGAVKYVNDVGGFGVATVLLREFQKPAGWNMDPRQICDIRKASLASAQTSLERELAGPMSGTKPFDLLQTHAVLGQLHAFHGQMARAIEQFEKSRAIAVSALPAVLLQVEEMLGVGYLHKAQLGAGAHLTAGDRCLLSPTRDMRLDDASDVAKAIDHFTRYLKEKPDELEVKWLLNLAHMMSGTYPGKVPPADLIPPQVFESPEDPGRFVDVAAKAGLVSIAPAGGVIVDDFDNDGRLDVVTSAFGSCEPMRLFRRAEDGLFVERSEAAGLSAQLGGLNLLQADYDNDGNLDILLLRGAWELPQRKSLLRNNGNGTFTDVTATAGLAEPATSTQAAAWTDVNQDGFLDLFIGNETSPAQLFLNKRDGTFEDVARRAGVARTAFSKGVGAADYDNDGWPDLYVSNLGGTNFLYHNNRNGTFTEVSQEAGVPGSGNGFATWFFDYDNDGWQDLFATSYFLSVDETARTYLGLANNAASLKLYRNLGNGRFQDVTRRAGLNKVFMPMGANYGDIDNDGYLDIYLGTGNPSYASILPSVLLRNRGGNSFVDVTTASGTGELHKGHGVAFADLDNDGDEEIVFEVGGATPADAHPLRLFENPGHGNDWIGLKLTGARSNRSAIGTRIAVTVESGGARRRIHRIVGSGGSFGASPLLQHIGLGRNARIVDIEIWWPTSGTRQHFGDVKNNQVIAVNESAKTYDRLDRPRLPLGGAPRDERSASR